MITRFLPKVFMIVLFAAAVSFAGFGPTAYSASTLTSYDTLSVSPIDAAKWHLYESVRVIDTDAHNLRLGVRSAGGSTGPLMSFINFASPGGKTKIAAVITPTVYVNADGASAMAVVAGRFYNDGSSGVSGDCTGDVLGQIGVGNTPSSGGAPVVFWTVVRATSSDCNSVEALSGGSFETPAVIGTAYPVTVEWDGAQFIFSYGGQTRNYVPSTSINAPNTLFKGMYTRVSNNAGKAASVFASFDDVYVNDALYDDFSANEIDASRWRSYEFVRMIKDKHLILRARTTANSTTSSESYLPINAPDSVRTIQADVVAHRLFSADPAKVGVSTYVGGRFFNDGSEGEGYTGDIGAFTRLQTKGDGTLTGRWWVTRFTGTTIPEQEVLCSHDFTKPIALDKAYTLSVGWDGTKFNFKGGSESFSYTPDPEITVNLTNAKVPYKGLSAVVMGWGTDAQAAAYFTKVMVEKVPQVLTIEVSGAGSVKSSPVGINCSNEGGQCSQPFADGRKVTLTAKAGKGYVFDGWSGCAGSSKATCSVTMGEAKTVTAVFASNPTLVVSPVDKKFGNVKANSKTSTATFSVTNKTTKGTAPLTIGEIYLTPDEVSVDDFAIVSDTCSDIDPPLAANKKCTFKVVFGPKSMGAKSATVTIPSDDPASPETVIKVSGTGTTK